MRTLRISLFYFLICIFLLTSNAYSKTGLGYNFLVELGEKSLKVHDKQEAIQYFMKANIVYPGGKEAVNYLQDLATKVKFSYGQKIESFDKTINRYRCLRADLLSELAGIGYRSKYQKASKDRQRVQQENNLLKEELVLTEEELVFIYDIKDIFESELLREEE